MEEIIWLVRPEPKRYRAALFDFDGTISLIREGWQPIMYSYFTEVLLETPQAEAAEEITAKVREFVDRLTGQQTIYQCLQLVEEVAARSGQPQAPLTYKQEYHDRLLRHIAARIQGLQDGTVDPSDLLVPGVVTALQRLQDAGVTLYLASGTDERYVVAEAAALGVAGYFGERIYGAQDDYQQFSKAKVIQERILPVIGDPQYLLGFGDGYVEIENVRRAGGTAVGVASDERRRQGMDPWKKARLETAGAHCLVGDFRVWPRLEEALWKE